MDFKKEENKKSKDNDNIEEHIKIIESKTLETEKLINEREKETAHKILKELEGLLIIRADKVLKFCINTLKYKRM